MSLLNLILLSFLLLFIVVLSCPVFIRLESSLTVMVHWVFIKVRLQLENGSVDTQIRLFGKKLKNRRRSASKKPPGKAATKRRSPKKTTKLTVTTVGEILQEAVTTRIVKQVLHFCRRLVCAFRIHLLKWDIGLTDYYWQGITMGILGGVPPSERIQIRGNFNAENDFVMILRLSLWRTLGAVFLLLVRFPYYQTFRLYRRIRSY
jgi:hypothetical protein